MPKINVLSGLHKENATRIQSTCWSIAESLVHHAFRCMPEMCRKLLPTQRHDKKSCSDCTKHKNIYTMRRIEMWTRYGNATTNTPNAPFGGPTESAPAIQPLWRQNVVPLVKHATKSCPRIELLSNACKLNRLRDLFPRVNQDLLQQQGAFVLAKWMRTNRFAIAFPSSLPSIAAFLCTLLLGVALFVAVGFSSRLLLQPLRIQQDFQQHLRLSNFKRLSNLQ